jgi:4-diphosphocytidyl-2-C-methyl-D-erythritol kinase
MLVFPNCKINLGLHVVAKRPDGFHNIETVFYPVSWCDALEILENGEHQRAFTYSQSGIPIDGKPEENLLYRAWEIISKQKKLPPIKVHLHKNIPMGAGLGGGSSDAAYFINLLNSYFDLGYSDFEKMEIASRLGSDCAFFIKNKPVLAKEKGNVFSEVQVELDSYYILIVYPGIHSNTRDAYNGLVPIVPGNDPASIIKGTGIKEWKNLLVNDFEISIFKKYPGIKSLKESLYEAGAFYSSMSGSGSAVFGIFEKEPQLKFPATCLYYLQKPKGKIL